jgi:enoyl-CoA hydratase
MADIGELSVEIRDGGVAVLSLTRPAAGNSINVSLAEALEEALTRLTDEPGLVALIVTAAGGRFFCTGGDLKEYRAIETRDDLEAVFGRVRRVLDRLEEFPVPVIAAVEGYALGGGAELVLACDHRIAAAGAQLGFAQVRLGIVPGWNGIERLVRAAGRWRATDLLATGRRLDAQEALAVGLLDRVVPDGHALQAAFAFAAELRHAAPMALTAVKRLVADAEARGRESRAGAADLFADLWFSADHREAEAAFAEKRKPVFGGH